MLLRRLEHLTCQQVSEIADEPCCVELPAFPVSEVENYLSRRLSFQNTNGKRLSFSAIRRNIATAARGVTEDHKCSFSQHCLEH